MKLKYHGYSEVKYNSIRYKRSIKYILLLIQFRQKKAAGRFIQINQQPRIIGRNQPLYIDDVEHGTVAWMRLTFKLTGQHMMIFNSGINND